VPKARPYILAVLQHPPYMMDAGELPLAPMSAYVLYCGVNQRVVLWDSFWWFLCTSWLYVLVYLCWRFWQTSFGLQTANFLQIFW